MKMICGCGCGIGFYFPPKRRYETLDNDLEKNRIANRPPSVSITVPLSERQARKLDSFYRLFKLNRAKEPSQPGGPEPAEVQETVEVEHMSEPQETGKI